jgi:murein DD-endopeptidase MepM/ murein hydrolase activator NlpD
MGAHLHFEIRYEQNVNLAENVSLLYAKDYWAFDNTWKRKFFDLGLIYGYDEDPSHPLPK